MDLLKNFNNQMKEDIFDYYLNTYSYIEDLFSYKNIDLKTIIDGKSVQTIKETVETMVKVTKVSLKTIGIPKERINSKKTRFQEIVMDIQEHYSKFGDYFNKIKELLNYFLYHSVIDYLTDNDQKQLETADLFDLLPKGFKNKIALFKKKHQISIETRNNIYQQLREIENDFDFSSLLFRPKPTKLERPLESLYKEKLDLKSEIITKEKDANEKNSMALENPETMKRKSSTSQEEKIKISEILKKELEPSIESDKSNALNTGFEEKQTKNGFFIFNKVEEGKEEIIKREEKTSQKDIIQKPLTEKKSVKSLKLKKVPGFDYPRKASRKILGGKFTFIDYFGNSLKLKKSVLEQFNINSINLLNSRISRPKEHYNLECLFYYISILKQLGLTVPFSSIEIIELTKNFLYNKLFCNDSGNEPDPISIFYGLCIFQEMNILERKDILDLDKIKEFLEAELKTFIPQKFHFCYFAALSLKVLENTGLYLDNGYDIIDPIIRLNLSKLEQYNPSNDIYEQLVLIKLFETDGKTIPTHFKGVYSKELKNIMDKDGSINGRISDTAKVLLSFDLLDLKEKESGTCNKLIKFLSGTTKYFDSGDLDKDFNWQEHQLAYLIELKMLYWTLLACSQYSEIF